MMIQIRRAATNAQEAQDAGLPVAGVIGNSRKRLPSEASLSKYRAPSVVPGDFDPDGKSLVGLAVGEHVVR